MNLKLTFSPQVAPGELTVTRAGAILTINGIDFDLSAIEDGGEALPDAFVGVETFIVGTVRRVSGQVEITLRQPYAAPGTAIERNPPVLDNPPDGQVWPINSI